MGLRMKKFNIIRVHWKIEIFKGVGFTKNQYTGGKLPKKEGGRGWGAWAVCRIKGSGAGVFEGWVDTQILKMIINNNIKATFLLFITVFKFHGYTVFKENYRSSHRRCFIRKGILKNFTKFTGKHLCQSPFFNKVAGLRSATLLKKRLWHKCFPVNFVTFLSTPFLQNIFGRIFLKLSKSINFTKFLSKTVIHFTGIPQDFTWKITRDHFRENIS